MPNVSQSDPAEGSREVIERELERHKNDGDVPAKLNKRRKVRAKKTKAPNTLKHSQSA